MAYGTIMIQCEQIIGVGLFEKYEHFFDDRRIKKTH